MPPIACRAVWYAVPTMPVESGTGTTARVVPVPVPVPVPVVWAEMTKVSFAVVVNGRSLASVAWRTTVKDPLAVGVPLTTPVAALKVSPGGSAPDKSLSGTGEVPPVTLKLAEYC